MIGFGVILAAAVSLIPISVLTVRLPRLNGRPVTATRVVSGSEFLLGYRHSVELTDVEGRFRVGPGPTLLIKETRYTSVGSGLPNDRRGETRRENGWFVVDEGMRASEEIRFFILPVNRTRLSVDDRRFSFDHLKPGTLIAIKIERMPISRWLVLQARCFLGNLASAV